MTTPLEVHQLLPTLARGDAIGQHTLALQALLKGWGHASEIYCQHHDPALAGACRLVGDFQPTARTITLYHHSIGSEAVTDAFRRAPGKRAMVYHNITPQHWFAPYCERTWRLVKAGRESLSSLARSTDLALADSAYNAAELEALGFPRPRVLPILADFEGFARTPPDLRMAERLSEKGWTHFLFVGRLAPNKCQEDVIRAFAWYHRFIDRRSRLVLAGPCDLPAYRSDLEETARSQGVDRAVYLAGRLTFPELVACYRAADLFLCLSEHEGFCVPLLEAMAHDVPVLAYAAGAVPETLGTAGVLVRRKDFPVIAEMAALLVHDAALRERVVAEQRIRLADFSSAAIGELLAGYLAELSRGVGPEGKNAA